MSQSAQSAPSVKTVPDFVGVEAEPSHDGEGCWFGPETRPLFGWHHVPKLLTRDCVVVLCPPFGHEYMVAYRAYRKLATKLTQAGFAVFRFDYDGSGDSAGNAWDPGRVAAWQASIRLACDEARRYAGLKQVALFGVRLGALLAASVAAEASADALALLAPTVSGRLYVRELLAFRSMNAAAKGSVTPPASKPDGEEEVAGYALSEETRSALGLLDFTKFQGQVAPAALILARDDVPSGEGRIVTALTSGGTKTELRTGPGYGAMMLDDAYDSRVPSELWSKVVAWLSDRYPATLEKALPTSKPQGVAVFASAGAMVREELIRVNGIVGIITELVGHAPNVKRPAIVIANTGANHRVGNHRLCVTFARNWAARGFTVVRFDRPGIGDSATAPGARENAVYAPEGVSSIRSMMEHLSLTRGHNRFALAGLCSGAYFSFHTALRDSRVVGILMINPLIYTWRDGQGHPAKRPPIYKSTNFYVRAAANPTTWKRLVTGQIDAAGITAAMLRRWQSKVKSRYRQMAAAVLKRDSVTAVGRDFLALAARGTDIMMIFDADEGGIDLMHEHLRPDAELMRGSPTFRLEIVKDTDHTFTPLWAQQLLGDMVGQHWQERFP